MIQICRPVTICIRTWRGLEIRVRPPRNISYTAWGWPRAYQMVLVLFPHGLKIVRAPECRSQPLLEWLGSSAAFIIRLKGRKASGGERSMSGWLNIAAFNETSICLVGEVRDMNESATALQVLRFAQGLFFFQPLPLGHKSLLINLIENCHRGLHRTSSWTNHKPITSSLAWKQHSSWKYTTTSFPARIQAIQAIFKVGGGTHTKPDSSRWYNVQLS